MLELFKGRIAAVQGEQTEWSMTQYEKKSSSMCEWCSCGGIFNFDVCNGDQIVEEQKSDDLTRCVQWDDARKRLLGNMIRMAKTMATTFGTFLSTVIALQLPNAIRKSRIVAASSGVGTVQAKRLSDDSLAHLVFISIGNGS